MAFPLSSFGRGLVAVGCTGCATALSGFQPAHVPEKGHFQAETGIDVSIPTGTIVKTIDAADALDAVADERALTDAEKRKLLNGAVNLATNPPMPIVHFGGAYAPWEDWEIGLRFATGGWRVGVRRQLLDREESGIDFTVGVGVGRAAFEPPVNSVLGTIEIDDFVRWNIDLPITIGRHGAWYRWWAGPRLLYSSLSQSMSLSLPFEDFHEMAAISGHGFYLGGYGGAVFGYRWIFIGPELTIVHLWGSADVAAFDTEMRADLDSLIVYPGVALMGEF